MNEHVRIDHDAEQAITDAVLARYAGTENPRLREIILSLVKHLHSFAREVRLTVDEYIDAANYMLKLADISKGGRQEFIAMGDLLGLEMLAVQISQPKPSGATLPGVLGPFFLPGAPSFENGADIAKGAHGEPLFVSGRILHTSGEPVADARINVWQSDQHGLYDVQEDIAAKGMRTRGQLRGGADGRYFFWTVMPAAYPLPGDGGMGDLIKHTTLGGWRPAHVHFMVEADGHDTLVTQICARDSKYLDADSAFSVRDGLIADYIRHESGAAPDGRKMNGTFHTLDYDFVLTRNGQ